MRVGIDATRTISLVKGDETRFGETVCARGSATDEFKLIYQLSSSI